MKSVKKELADMGKLIEASVHIQQIGKGIRALESGVETIKQDGVELRREMDKTRVVALSKALEFRFKLLAKVLPDRKAMELDLGEQTLGAVREYSSIERAARLAFLLERIGAGRAGPDPEGRDAHLDSATRSADRCPPFLS